MRNPISSAAKNHIPSAAKNVQSQSGILSSTIHLYRREFLFLAVFVLRSTRHNLVGEVEHAVSAYQWLDAASLAANHYRAWLRTEIASAVRVFGRWYVRLSYHALLAGFIGGSPPP